MKLRKLKKIVSCLIVSLILTACSSNQKPIGETIKISADYRSYKNASDICD